MIGAASCGTICGRACVIFAVGLTLAAVVGVAAGLLLARFWVIDVALGVYITFLYSIPAVALVPLIVLWAGFEIDREGRSSCFCSRSSRWRSTPIRA